MTAREHAEELRQQAIQTLLDEKKAIDGMLRTLGNEETAPAEKRRGAAAQAARVWGNGRDSSRVRRAERFKTGDTRRCAGAENVVTGS